MDVLEIYNSIASAADNALQKTSTLIKQSQTLSSIKPIAGTLAAGALGPGIMLYDPLDKFIKGEASFAKASKDFVVDAKQLEMGGKIVAYGISKAGDAWLQNYPKIEKGIGSASKVIKDFTNTSKMMEDSIVSLSAKTGVFATSFKTAAQIIKVATGPIATALLATQTTYEMFVKRWIEESNKLQNNVQSLAITFKDEDVIGTFQGMQQYARSGGSREQFLGLLQNAPYRGETTARTAFQIAEITKIVTRETGRSQREEFNKYMQHFAVRGMGGVSEQEIRRELIQRRVMAGGPGAELSIKNPVDRYREWEQDLGYNFSVAGSMMSPGMGIRKAQFAVPGDISGRIRFGTTRAINAMQEYAPWLVGGPISPGMAGRAVSSLSQLSTLAGVGLKRREANQQLAHAKEIAAIDPEAAMRLQFLSGISAAEYVGGTTRLNLAPQQTRVAALEKESSENEQMLEAGKMIEKGREKMPVATKELHSIVQKYAAAKTGDEWAEANEYASELASRIGVTIQELVNFAKVSDEWTNKIARSGGLDQVAEKQKRTAEKLREETKKAVEMQKAIGIVDEMELPVAGTMSFKDIGSASYVQLQQAELAHQKGMASTQRRLKEIQLGETKPSAGYSNIKTEKKALEREMGGYRQEETGLSAEDEAKYNKYMGKAADAKTNEEREKYIKWANDLRTVTKTQARRSALGLQSDQTRIKLQEAQMEIAGLQVPTQIAALGARGIIDKSRVKEITDITAKNPYEAQIEVQKEQAKHKIALQKVDVSYIPRQRKLEGVEMGVQARALGSTGVMDEKSVTRVQDLVAKGDEVSLRHAQQILALTEKRYQIEESIVDLKIKEAQREGVKQGLGLQMGVLQRQGSLSDEERWAIQANMEGGTRAADKGAPVIQNILSVRKKMMDDELQFTVQYTQARMNIIKTHYDNAIQTERGKLEEADRKKAPELQYGRDVYGTQQIMANAEVNRHAGEDYWRQQAREKISLKEQGQDLMIGLAGGEVPRAVQMARSIRDYRRRKKDFAREQARTKEADEAGIGAQIATEDALAKEGMPISELEKTEGGRDLRLQMLQQNQAAYSRRGINVEFDIKRLAREKQIQAGKKLAVEKSGRDLQSKSIEEQIGVMEGGLEKLKPEQQGKAKADLAEKYREASQHYLSIGDTEKAKEYQGKQEKALEQVPEMLKRDFGDVQKQSLNELKTQTEVLKSINTALGGENPEAAKETGTGIESGEGEVSSKKTGAQKFSAEIDKFGAAIDKLASTRIQVNVNGPGTASVSQGGAGSYGPPG